MLEFSIIVISMSVISQGTWTVIVRTGNKDKYSETDSDVYLTITGSAGTSRELVITDKLFRNQAQTFIFTNVGNVGVVSSLHVRLGPGKDGWEFESITLHNARSQYSFVYGKWLSNYGTKKNPRRHADYLLTCLTCLLRSRRCMRHTSIIATTSSLASFSGCEG